MMKAIILTGKPETRSDITKFLSVSESVPKPSIKPNEVLVRVKASGLNIEDVIIGVGRMLVSITATKEAPVVLGQEFSGVVEEVGSNVKELKQGDKVFGHKFGLKIRFGSWAEFVAVDEQVLVKMGENYSFAESAALPMSALVAYGAAKATGLFGLPVLENIPHKTRNQEDVVAVKDVDNEALIMDTKIDKDILKDTKIALVGASSTIGLMVLDMLASRGEKVVGVSSASSAAPVLANGAVAVLDRHVDGGLARKGDMQFDIVIDCIGGQEIEDSARKALGSRGHFITVVGPGENNFAEGMVGVGGHLGHAVSIAARTFKSMFCNSKYTLATMPLSGKAEILEDLMKENLKSVIDSEVEMFNEDSVHKAVDKVNNHKNKGRLVFVV